MTRNVKNSEEVCLHYQLNAKVQEERNEPRAQTLSESRMRLLLVILHVKIVWDRTFSTGWPWSYQTAQIYGLKDQEQKSKMNNENFLKLERNLIVD